MTEADVCRGRRAWPARIHACMRRLSVVVAPACDCDLHTFAPHSPSTAAACQLLQPPLPGTTSMRAWGHSVLNLNLSHSFPVACILVLPSFAHHLPCRQQLPRLCSVACFYMRFWLRLRLRSHAKLQRCAGMPMQPPCASALAHLLRPLVQWLLRLQPGSFLAPAQLPAPAPVLHLPAPVRRDPVADVRLSLA